MKMAKQNLASMSVDSLLKLRDDIGDVLNRKADELKVQLSRLDGDSNVRRSRKSSTLKGRKAAIKYRHPKTGETWSGRGAQAGWLTREIKAGAKRDDFLVDKSARRASKKAGRKRRKK
jgi:DNA-binding protein H-NS